MNPIVLRNIALALKKISYYMYDVSCILYFIRDYNNKNCGVNYTRNLYIDSYLNKG